MLLLQSQSTWILTLKLNYKLTTNNTITHVLPMRYRFEKPLPFQLLVSFPYSGSERNSIIYQSMVKSLDIILSDVTEPQKMFSPSQHHNYIFHRSFHCFAGCFFLLDSGIYGETNDSHIYEPLFHFSYCKMIFLVRSHVVW